MVKERILNMVGCTIAALKRTKSTNQNTDQAHACIKPHIGIKVSADSLLQLARWCRQRQCDSNTSPNAVEQGGSSCQPTFPPALSTATCQIECSNSDGTTVGSAPADEATIVAQTPDANTKSTAHSNRKGGSR